MDRERLRRARAAMTARGLDALICRLPENVLLLSGHWSLTGMAFLLFPREGTPLCVVPHCDEREAQKELWNAECVSYLSGILAAGNPYADTARLLKPAVRGKRFKRVGFEGDFEAIAPPWNAAEPVAPAAATRGVLEDVFGTGTLVDATDLFYELRARKTPAEQEKLRRVNEIAAMGLRAFQEAVDVGASGIGLASLVEHVIQLKGTGYKGALRVRAFAQVSGGAAETSRGFRPMEITTTRKLRKRDLALLELAVVADGFWADRTRVCAAGAATPKQQEVFDVVCRAQEAAIRSVRPRVAAGDVDAAARSIIRAAGYDKEFFHVAGHGTGFRYHEPTPLICPDSPVKLAEGMVHTVEPGIYFAGFGGIRVEDNVLVTRTGAEVLGPAPKRLAP
jgi:Xaa-Pro dipeptidase